MTDKFIIIAAMLNAAVSQGTIHGTICKPDWTTRVRPPSEYTNKLKRSQLPKGARLDLYEEDHFISIGLGGNPRSPTNLWPQPWNGVCGALKKDIDERHYERMVCAGKMLLNDARQSLADKWGHCRK